MRAGNVLGIRRLIVFIRIVTLLQPFGNFAFVSLHCHQQGSIQVDGQTGGQGDLPQAFAPDGPPNQRVEIPSPAGLLVNSSTCLLVNLSTCLLVNSSTCLLVNSSANKSRLAN